MAIYHAHLKNFSRGRGDSAVAAAAYRAGLDLVDTQTKEWHRYARRHGVAEFHMLAPAGSPQWCSDAAVFWDASQAIEKRKNAMVARELEVSLPHEMTPEQRSALALDLAQILVDRYQCVVLAAVHEPSGEGDTRNHHVHCLMSARQVGPTGFGPRAAAVFDARGGKGAEEVRVVRALVSEKINAHFRRAGIDQTVDHRSLRDQASAAAARGDHALAVLLTRPPQGKIGKEATALERKERAADAAAQAMDAAIAEAAGRGVLAPTPAAHSHAAAFGERLAARRENPPVHAIPWGRVARPLRAGEHSHLALRLSRLGRIARAQGGAGAEIINSESELIEKWLDTMAEAAEAAINSARPAGMALEPVETRALEALRLRRVHVYAAAPGFFEGTETLSWAIQNYADELIRPHRNRERLWRAKARLSEVENPAQPGTQREVVRARRALTKAKLAVSTKALRAGQRRLTQARQVMEATRADFEEQFYITKVNPVVPDLADPFDLGETSSTAISGSNRRELKPRPRSPFGQ